MKRLVIVGCSVCLLLLTIAISYLSFGHHIAAPFGRAGSLPSAAAESPQLEAEEIHDPKPFSDSPAMLGGATTRAVADETAFTLPVANLIPSEELALGYGRDMFMREWIEGKEGPNPALVGLGPLFS